MPPEHTAPISQNRATDTPQRSSFSVVRVFSYAFLSGVFLMAILSAILVLLTRRPEPQPIVLHPPPTPTATLVPTPTATPAPLVIFVSGAVNSPGLYTLPADSRVGEALMMAGGFAEDANVDAVNQAELLYDGVQVYVPHLTDDTAAVPPPGVSGDSPVGDGTAQTGTPAGRINVNTASIAELESLPGIGPTKAAAMIEHRPFTSVEDLARVPGIGPATIEKLRAAITVQ